MAEYPVPGASEFSAEDEQAMRASSRAESRTPASAVGDAEQQLTGMRGKIGRGQANLNQRALELEGRKRGPARLDW